MRTTFARIYPVIANQVLEQTGIIKGTCLDVGSGPALLAIARSLLSELFVTTFNSSSARHELARGNIRDRCMEDRVFLIIEFEKSLN